MSHSLFALVIQPQNNNNDNDNKKKRSEYFQLLIYIMQLYPKLYLKKKNLSTIVLQFVVLFKSCQNIRIQELIKTLSMHKKLPKV